MKKMLEIIALPSGAHRNQTYHGILSDGWAVVPDNMVLENFPFGRVEAAEVDGIMTVTKWTPSAMPEPIEPERTPAEQREAAYNTQPLIEWDGETLTVTQAAQKWQYYAAEGSTRADELQALIATTKQTIRAQHPDEEVPE